jgi:uncharacterized protein (DUF2141 family)
MLLRLMIASLLLSFLSSNCSAGELTVTVDGLRNNSGYVLLCLFSAKTSNADEPLECAKGRAVRTSKAIISGSQAVLRFDSLEDGVYAVTIIHDENGNGALDKNFLGIPSEGVGVSTNPSVSGKPRFAQGKFKLNGNMNITINTKYIF